MDGLNVRGKVVWVTEQQAPKTGRWYKRLQIQFAGNRGRLITQDVMDMSNGQYGIGDSVELPVSIDVFQGRRGVGYSLTHWGNDNGKAVAASVDPSASSLEGKFK